MAVKKTSGARRRRAGANIPGAICVSAAIVCAAVLLGRDRGVVEARQETAPVVAEFDSVSVPVPAEPVPAGARISSVKFRQLSFPKHQVPDGAVIDLAALHETVAVVALPANLPIFRENLSDRGFATNPVLERIPAGMRAMTIKVDATAAVEGWAGSGTSVDVILVEKERSSVIAENVRILSAERKVAPVDGAASPHVPSTVTLLVSQEQCLAINTAIPLGKLAFALRGGGDSESWDSPSFAASNLKGAARGNVERRDEFSGYATVREGETKKAFALSNGKWIRSEVVPEGFMVNQPR